MLAYLFPGQGSQAKGMGDGLFDEYPDLTQQADSILGYSIKNLCLQDPERTLHKTQYTQPALYVVNALSYRQKIRNIEALPDFLAGHSLGEYNALEASGVISFEDGLRLVKKRGELMSEAPRGAMAAVLGLSADETRDILRTNDLSTIDIANYNTHLQLVLSGLEEDIRRAEPLFSERGIKYLPVNARGAFHSRYMMPIKNRFEDYLQTFMFSDFTIPVISNVHARPYEKEHVEQNLSNQITHSVKWLKTIKYLIEQGEVARDRMRFEELGVGNVLTKMLRHVDVQSEHSTVEKIEKEILHPYKKIENWNNRYPVGIKVKIEGFEGDLETRTEAMLLFGHRAAIYMQGYNGYFSLDDVIPQES